jgi:hypothetical protein
MDPLGDQAGDEPNDDDPDVMHGAVLSLSFTCVRNAPAMEQRAGHEDTPKVVTGGRSPADRDARSTGQLKRDDDSSNRHHALAGCLSMIFSENRCTLFGIML